MERYEQDIAAHEWEQDLRDGAREILRAHPGISEGEWRATLKRLYPLEVVDTFGTDEAEIGRGLESLWNTINVSKE